MSSDLTILGIGASAHDTSICLYQNGHVKYLKSERILQLKHHHADCDWIEYILKLWNVYRVDYLISTVPVKLNIGFRKKYIIDHHEAHLFSRDKIYEQYVVSDAKGNDKKNSLVVGKHIHKIGQEKDNLRRAKCFPYKQYGIEKGLCIDPNISTITNCLFPNGNPLSGTKNDYVNSQEQIDWLDVTGKLMGLQAYDEKLQVIQNNFSQSIIGLFTELDKNKPVYYSGGHALNILTNRYLLDEGYDVRVMPYCSDEGLSVGCVNYGLEQLNIDPIKVTGNWSEEIIDTPSDSTIERVAESLSKGKIVAWYQGLSEVGPRALGKRSILMDPSVVNGKDIINRVKNREWWRPFGASVKNEKALEYFDMKDTPHMLFNTNVKVDNLSAVTHEDKTCRIQTVDYKQESYYALLDKFEKLTGLPVLLNTSLNKAGRPIVYEKNDAIDLFKSTEIDVICIGNEVYEK